MNWHVVYDFATPSTGRRGVGDFQIANINHAPSSLADIEYMKRVARESFEEKDVTIVILNWKVFG